MAQEKPLTKKTDEMEIGRAYIHRFKLLAADLKQGKEFGSESLPNETTRKRARMMEA